MTEETDSIRTALQEFFLQEFNKGRRDGDPDVSSLVLTFEMFPVSVAPEDYMLNAQDVNSFSQAKLDEVFSRMLTDYATLRQGNYRLPANAPISESYFWELLGPSEFVSDPQATAQANEEAAGWFARLKQKAKSEFKTVVSVMGQAEEFALSDSLPDSWLDPRRPELWQRYSFTAQDDPTTGSGQTPKPDKLGLPKPDKLGLPWRSLDEQAVGTRMGRLTEVNAALPPQPAPAGTPTLMARRQFSARAIATGEAPASSATTRASDVSAARTREARAVLSEARVASTLQGAAPAERSVQLMQLMQVAPRPASLAANLSIQNRIDLRPELAQTLSEAVVETKPSIAHVKVSFSYQTVRVSRNWFFRPFLHYQHWCVPGVKRGFYANPDEAPGHGALSLIPVALIVIRDVSIEGNWTQADAAQLSKAFAIGPFGSGQKAEIVGESLIIKGTQILGCINEPSPVLPPRSDPRLVP